MNSSHPSSSKVLLVTDRAARGGVNVPVRRYRIARIRPENRPTSMVSRLDRLSR